MLVYLGVGGSGACGKDLSDDLLFPKAEEIDQFANQVIWIVKEYNLDGVDISYPCKDQHADNAIAFVKKLRSELPSQAVSWANVATGGDAADNSGTSGTFEAVKSMVSYVN